jgi:hypothetical protein
MAAARSAQARRGPSPLGFAAILGGHAQRHLGQCLSYDEYFIAYRERSSSVDRASLPEAVLGGHAVAVEGQAVGGWRRHVSKGRITITASLLVTLHNKHKTALEAAGQRYSQFTGMPVELVVS